MEGNLSITDLVRMERYYNVAMYLIENPTASVEEACAINGVPVRTFYDWRSSHADALVAVRDSFNIVYRQILADLPRHIFIGIRRAMDIIADPNTKPEILLMFLKYFIPYTEDMTKVFNVAPGGEDRAPFLKRGPVLEPAQSRIATVDVRVDGSDVRVDVYRDDPVIDAEARDAEDSTPEQSE